MKIDSDHHEEYPHVWCCQNGNEYGILLHVNPIVPSPKPPVYY